MNLGKRLAVGEVADHEPDEAPATAEITPETVPARAEAPAEPVPVRAEH